MNFIRKHRIFKLFTLALTFNLLLELLVPATAFALTAGPNSPEFSSFEPVATTDMVSPFTGDFTYNLPVVEIPGPDGAGYALSLSYHSGASVEEEASWVGYGWSLNPGAINRGMRGFPDDFNGDSVHQYNKTIPNWSASMSEAIGLEVNSKDAPPKTADAKQTYSQMLSISASSGLRFNNYQGFSRQIGMNASVKGIGSLGMTTDAQGTTFDAKIDVSSIVSKGYNKYVKKIDNNKATVTDKETTTKARHKAKMRAKRRPSLRTIANSNLGSSYGLFTWSEAVRSLNVNSHKGRAFNWSIGATINPAPAPIGGQVGYTGNFNMQWSLDNDISAYGYMHNPVTGGENVAGDYYVEKGNPYSKRDYFLGMPFNNADNFMVAGEGLSGGFRYYPENLRQSFPTQKKSKTTIYQMGVELDYGADLGIGLDFGIGYNKLVSKDWGMMGNEVINKFDDAGSNGVFRFNNDFGGKIEYGNNDVAAADLYVASYMPGAKAAYINIDSTKVTPTWSNKNKGRSSYIQKLGSDKIEGFSIVNEGGVSYTYGQPVYARKETSVQVDVRKVDKPRDKYLAFQDLYLGSDYSMDETKHRKVVGEKRDPKYATSCLLTQITSADYVDVGTAGPDNADFGAWTKFAYHQIYGGNNAWYRWRTPYQGLLYEMGEIATSKDDGGSVQTGEKEVYYLKAVETKTHIAYFVTNKTYASRYSLLPSDTTLIKGSQKARLDGLAAWKLTGSKDNAATGSKGNQQLEYLEKIVVFSKTRMDKPLKVVNFDYDYSLVQNLPNNSNGNYPNAKNNTNSGKLTLKKVWFDYEGTYSSRISPYEFVYKYKDKTDYPKEILDRYPDLVNSNLNYSDASQNPDYNPHLMDPWGNLQMYGEERQEDLKAWPYQGKYPIVPLAGSEGPLHWQNKISNESAGFFDPAAWQLKQIKLPSGGEILVDYEQKDYRYVQDRQVMSMVSLIGFDDEDETILGSKKLEKNPVYYINLPDININESDSDFTFKRDSLIESINRYFGTDGESEKVYFKFLYNLSIDGSSPDLDECSSEYITGYAKFKSCQAATLNGKQTIKVTLQGENSSDGDYTNVPRQACYDFVSTQMVGKIKTSSGDPANFNDDCQSVYEQIYDGLVESAANDHSDKESKFGIANSVMKDLHHDLGKNNMYRIPKKMSVCTSMNPRLSYLKLPMVTAKRGGGVRVKRLLMYDPGIETGDAALYGSEFLYQTEDGKSSGVATTEPSEMREENPLIYFMPRKGQSFFSRITAGKDKEQTEGPLGESILPSPSVGHSRVVVKNIHSGKTGTGFMVHEFFTTKDYPFDKQYLDGRGVESSRLDDNKLTDHMSIPAGLFNYSTNKVWATQGFRFIINCMNGEKKRTATYGGDYSNPNSRYLTSSESYNYFEPGEKVKMIHYTNGQFILKEDNPGKEMDVAMEMSAVHENTLDLSVEIDITIAIPELIVYVGAAPTVEVNENIIRTHATTKIIRYPALVKSVTSFKDGATTSMENLAFNPHNGQVIVTRSNDSYDNVKIKGSVHDGHIYNINVPASWIYNQMGQKAENSSYSNQLSESAGSIVSYGAAGNPLVTSDSVLTWFASPKNVLSAGAQVFSNAWTSSWTDPAIDAQYGSSAYVSQLNKVYRPQKSYVYKDSIVSANTNKIYNSGMYKSFQTYWNNPSNPKWIKVNEVTKYSPNGSALEELDVLKTPSAARFGYANNIMPVIIAHNSDYNSIHFEDYENSGSAVSGIAHSGNKSMLITSAASLMSNISSLSTSSLAKKGGIMNFWLREDAANTNDLDVKIAVNALSADVKKVAQTGEWSLYRCEIPKEAFAGGNYSVVINYNPPSTGNIYVDDLKIQPVDAQVTCYVYDVRSLRVLTQFDDWHFGMYYQYNDEGKLVRKMIETERGLKTIQETQYNMPKESRQ